MVSQIPMLYDLLAGIVFRTFFVTVICITKDAVAIFNESVDKEAKRYECKTKAHIGLREQSVYKEVVSRCQYGDCYEQTHTKLVLLCHHQ